MSWSSRRKSRATPRKSALSLPLDSLSKAAQQTGADLSIETALGIISVPNDAVAAICSAAGGTDIVFTVRAGTAQQAAELLEGKADVSAALLRESAVIGVEVSSNGREIADFGGESVSLYLPVDGERFESGKSYTVYQISGDGTVEKLTGKCVLRGG